MAGVAPLSERLPLPAFAPVARLRPVAVVQPGTDLPPAPYAAVERAVDGPTEVSLSVGGSELRAGWDGRRVALHVDGRTHVSRRHGAAREPRALALALTGPFVTAFVEEAGIWVARAVVDLAEDGPAHLATAPSGADGDRAGAFGQLGLRDVRLVTHADGTAYDGGEGRVLLTATSAGPGGFRTGHTSVWSLDPDTLDLAHRGDLFFRRDGGVLGDHATHLVRDGDRWLVATSTWGDFDKRRNPRVAATLAVTSDDVTRGCHVLDAEPLALPAPTGSVGLWDPHLVRDGDRWLAAYVSASRFFRFHPVVAEGPSLDRLTLRAAASDRTATEGPTLARVDGAWHVLASDGRDGPRAHRAAYPVLDLDLRQRGRLDAAYPTNLPWPTLVELPGRDPLLLGFNGTPHGGPLLGYGTHGDLVVQRPVEHPANAG